MTPDNPLRGIALKIASVATFVVMWSLIKAVGVLPVGQVVFFRSFFAMLPIVVFFAWRGDLFGAFRTAHPWSHLLRGLVGVTAMSLGFFGLARLPLPESITIGYAQPLLVVVFSAVILRETIRVYRWSAVVVGLVGVLVISWPKLTLLEGGMQLGNGEAVGALAALAAAAVSANVMILIRRLVQTENTGTIVVWFSMSASAFGLLTLPFGWAPLSAAQAALLILAGFCGGVGQLLMTQAYRHAEASVVAPFEYTSMILGIAVGYVVFSDVPSLNTLVGGAIVVGAGLFIILRERALGIERAESRRANAPQ